MLNVAKAAEYVAQCQNFDGGFGVAPGHFVQAWSQQLKQTYRQALLQDSNGSGRQQFHNDFLKLNDACESAI